MPGGPGAPIAGAKKQNQDCLIRIRTSLHVSICVFVRDILRPLSPLSPACPGKPSLPWSPRSPGGPGSPAEPGTP